MDADLGADTNRRHGLGFGEDLGIGTDPHLQILRPDPTLLQSLFKPVRCGRARHNRSQIAADFGVDGLADTCRGLGIALGLFFNDPLQHADHKGHPAGLDRLQIDGSQKYGWPDPGDRPNCWPAAH